MKRLTLASALLAFAPAALAAGEEGHDTLLTPFTGGASLVGVAVLRATPPVVLAAE